MSEGDKKNSNLLEPKCPDCGTEHMNEFDLEPLEKDGDTVDVYCYFCDSAYVVELNILTRYTTGKIEETS